MTKEAGRDYFGNTLKKAKFLASKYDKINFPKISQLPNSINPKKLRAEIAELIKQLSLRPSSRSIAKRSKGEPSKHYAPYGCVFKTDFYTLCETEEERNELYNDLIDNGYLDIYGNTLEKFKNVKAFEALEVKTKFNALKEDVWVILKLSSAHSKMTPYHISGGVDKLQVGHGDIEKPLHEWLDFDDKFAYIGAMIRRHCWMSKLNEQELEKWERDEIWRQSPAPPIKHFICLRKNRIFPNIIPQEMYPPNAAMLNYYLSRKIDASYLRWRHSDIEAFLNGKTQINPEKLFSDIVAAYKQYCYFESEETYYLLALWIIGTYLFPLFPAYPLILINGPFGSGKSRTSTVSSCMAFNAQPQIDPYPPAIFRLADKQRASLFFDDTEWLAGKTTSRILSILKSSYKPTARVPRVGENKDGSIDEYEIYSPKMFNNKYGIEEGLASRTITILQNFAPQKAKIDKHDPETSDPQWAEIRNRLYLFTLNYWLNIKELIPKQKNLHLHGRTYELYAGLLAIAEFLDHVSRKKGMHKLILNAAVKDDEERKNEYLRTNPEALAIQALRELVLADGWYSSSKIASEINEISASPKKLTPAETGKVLKSFGFGKKGEWSRPRKKTGSDQTRPTEYLIRKKAVIQLAKRHGIIDT